MNYTKSNLENIEEKEKEKDNNKQNIKFITKNLYCTNCNKRGHTYNKCFEPVISNGIISFYIENFDYNLISLLENYIKKNINNKNILKNSNIKNIKKFENKIKFLLVQRKHSLGYIEFMRGKYDIANNEQIKYLFEQMTPDEIILINSKDFNYLWNMLWFNNQDLNITIKNKYHYKEYILSKQKFYQLKITNSNVFLTKSTFSFNEWGFPKGRREIYETDLLCAMREFEEETNFKESEYQILDEQNIIIENLIGTNGKKYRHNYFLALINNQSILQKKNVNSEIGDIDFFNINQCLEMIRPYHINKQTIIKNIYYLIINFLIDNSNI